MNYLVSIIVPVYNVGKYLDECLQTMVKQSYKNIEIILVDDGSTDNSGEILDQWQKRDSRVKVFHQENKGVSSARNLGLDKAQGDYICFADGDDYLMEDYVEYLLDMILKHDADISLTKYTFTNYLKNQVEEDPQVVCTPEQTCIDLLSYNIPIGVYCKMFKSSFLKDNIRFIPDIYIGEGFNFNMMAFQRASKIVVGKRRVYFYRRNNPNSATTKFSIDKWVNGLRAIEIIKENMIIHTPAMDTAWTYANWHTHADVLNFMLMASAEREHPEMYAKCKKVVKKDFLCAFRVPIRPREKVRAIIMAFCPSLMPKLMRLRSKLYRVQFQ